MKKTLVIVLLGLGGVALGLLFGAEAWRQKDDPRPQLARLEALSLPDVERNPREGREWLGEVVVVNHWATWCPPCLEEIPMLIQYQEDNREHGVQVIGIAHDRLEPTLQFGDRMGINYPSLVAIVGGDDILKAHGNAHAGALPYTVVFDREGQLVRTFLGKLSRPELENMVTPFR